MKQTEDLSIAYQVLAIIRIKEPLTPSKLYVINEYITNVTENSIKLELNGEVIYLKESPFDLEIHEDKIIINRIILFPTELKSVGLRTTPVKL